jgi:hypothetical protein
MLLDQLQDEASRALRPRAGTRRPVAVEGRVLDLAASSDEALVAAAHGDSVTIFAGATGEAMDTWPAHIGSDVLSLAFIDAGTDAPRLLTAADDGSVRIWSCRGAPLGSLRGPIGSATAIAFSERARTLAVGAGGRYGDGNVIHLFESFDDAGGASRRHRLMLARAADAAGRIGRARWLDAVYDDPLFAGDIETYLAADPPADAATVRAEHAVNMANRQLLASIAWARLGDEDLSVEAAAAALRLASTALGRDPDGAAPPGGDPVAGLRVVARLIVHAKALLRAERCDEAAMDLDTARDTFERWRKRRQSEGEDPTEPKLEGALEDVARMFQESCAGAHP